MGRAKWWWEMSESMIEGVLDLTPPTNVRGYGWSDTLRMMVLEW